MPGPAFATVLLRPGRFPHPIRDSSGHSYRAPEIQQETHRRSLTAPVSLASDWKRSSDYLFGIDLFNHGFYWEAHETWEQLWIEFGRSGRDADFIKGLIKLAAAGVKAREGRPIGVQRHACRAKELFQRVSDTLTEANTRFVSAACISDQCARPQSRSLGTPSGSLNSPVIC